VCEREDGGERREQPGNGQPSTMLGVTLSLSKGHETGRRRSASFRLPNRYPCRSRLTYW
jgi:hypothetical protein